MNKFIGLLFLVTFAIGTDTFLITPLLPTLQERFHVPTAQAGWMMGAYAAGYTLFALIAGPLSDGWNRKTVLTAGLFAFSVTTALCGFAQDFAGMFVFRFAAGISAAFTAPQVWASIPSLVPPGKVIRAMGAATAGLAISQVLGVPIGSSLAVYHWQIPFFVIGGFSLLLGLIVWTALPSLPPAVKHNTQVKTATGSLLSRYIPLIRDSRARWSFLAYFLFQAGNFSAFTFMGRWMSDRFSLQLDAIGGVMIFMGLGHLAGTFISGPAADRFGRGKSIALGLLILIPLYGLLPLSPTVITAKGIYFIIFFIAGSVLPLMMNMLITLNPSIRGTISSLTSAVMYAAAALGAWLAGVLYAHFNGFEAVGLLTAFSYAASLVVVAILSTRKDRVSNEPCTVPQ